MTFREAKQIANDLSESIQEKAGRNLIPEITVEEPVAPEDELHFLRLTNWGYVYFNEAGSILFKELARLLKSSRPELAKIYVDGKRNFEVLRTSSAHNLAPHSTANERTQRLARAWMITNGGQPFDWAIACRALASELMGMLNCLRDAFELVANSGRETGIDRLLDAVDKAWPPHLFDDIVEGAAERLELSGFDAVAYRKSRQDRWRELASLFASRDEASAALHRIVDAELRHTFGDIHITNANSNG